VGGAGHQQLRGPRVTAGGRRPLVEEEIEAATVHGSKSQSADEEGSDG
jgi:hypothetical protein